jgi:hypothetical protein
MLEGTRSIIEEPECKVQSRDRVSRDWPLVSRWLSFAGIVSSAEYRFERRTEMLVAERRCSVVKAILEL